MDILDWELEIQKECVRRNESQPIVKLDFESRYSVWTEQILPMRLINVKAGDEAFAERMKILTKNDARALIKRAQREYLVWMDEPIFIIQSTTSNTSTFDGSKEMRKIELKRFELDANRQAINNIVKFTLIAYDKIINEKGR